jgi:hypothetical protein
MAVCGASGFMAHPPTNIANATKAWTGHFIYATYSFARRQHLPCFTRSSYGLTRLPPLASRSSAQLQDSSVPLDQRASPPLPRELKRKRVAALSALDAIHLSAASGAMRTAVHLIVPLDDRIAVITICHVGVKTTARALVANYWSHLLSLFIRHDCRPFVVVCCMLCCCDSV